jgi:hypothetical protein
MWMGAPFGYGQPGPAPPPQPYATYPAPPYVAPPPPPDPEPEAAAPPAADRAAGESDVAAMRRELDELKQMIRDSARPPARKKRKP